MTINYTFLVEEINIRNCKYCSLPIDNPVTCQQYHKECLQKHIQSESRKDHFCKICGKKHTGIGGVCWVCRVGKPKKTSDFKVKKICRNCRQEFLVSAGGQIYCIDCKSKEHESTGKRDGENPNNWVEERRCKYCNQIMEKVYKSRKYHSECGRKLNLENNRENVRNWVKKLTKEQKRERSKKGTRKKHLDMTDEEFEVWYNKKLIEIRTPSKKKKKKKKHLSLIKNPFPEEIKVDRHHIIKGCKLVVPLPRETHLYVNGDRLDEHYQHNRKWIEKVYGTDLVGLILSCVG